MRLLRTCLPFAAAGLLAAQAPAPLPEGLRRASERLAEEGLKSPDAYRVLGDLCDSVGNRLSGSPGQEKAIAWALDLLKAEGFDNVHAEACEVPHWVRGAEKAWTLLPTRHELSILGLGGSVGTPEGGLTADVVVVGSFAELDKLGEAGVKGKIVCYDVPFEGYGKTVAYRGLGASRAAKYGAVAALVRSVGPISLDTPHTGMMRYEEGLPKIPTAAVTIENATMLHRMQARGQRIQLHLEMAAHWMPDLPGANVVAEVRGSEKPEEVVLLSGHLDSWDVGQGAQDDGAGCVIALEAAHLIRRLGLKPKRTVRVVLFANEENGARGAKAYAEAHKAEAARIVAAVEADSGNGRAAGFSLDFTGEGRNKEHGAAKDPREAAARARLRALAPLFAKLGSTDMEGEGSGVDVTPLVELGVPGLGLANDTSHYWDIHHTKADTFDKVVKADLDHNVATMAILAYALADMDERLATVK